MGEQSMWVGSASEDTSMSPPWAKNPQALAGRLRRAQTFLRMLDIEVIFSREGRSGARIIRMSALGHSRSRAVGMDWVASCLTTKRSLSAVGDCTRPAKRTSACSIHRIPWAVHRARPRRYAKLSWSVPSAGSNSSSWTIWDPKRSRPIGFRRSRRPCIQCEAGHLSRYEAGRGSMSATLRRASAGRCK